MKKIKLTTQEIDTLQWMRRVAGVTHARLARDYGISRRTVARIIARDKKRRAKT
jgi:DNA-binding transcriptional regulator LsrR (DeoR family)